MTVSYMEKDPATDKDAQMQARQAGPQQGEQAFGSVFLSSVLAMALLFLGGAIVKLARKTDLRDRWRMNASQVASKPHDADLEETTGRTSSAAARYDALVRGLRGLPPRHMTQESAHETMRDLQRAVPARQMKYARALS